ATEGALPGHLTMERAEDLPLDLALSFGLIAAGVAVWFALRWLRAVVPAGRNVQPARVAALCAIVTVAVHDLLDFCLWVGATGYVAAILAGWLAGMASLEAAGPGARARPAQRAVLVPLVAASALAGFFTVRSPIFVARDTAEAAARGELRPTDAQLRSAL